ncbi:MAG: hypothetical protein OEW72_03775, partial [Gammaproteobacteria bacterium]|nr:hypothetical protein [Gammaproteobacteria bacterium]
MKGPLAQARVQIYTADPGAADLAGRLVAEGTTDAAAQFTGLELPRPLATLYLVRVSSDAVTLDLATGQAPFLPQLEMLVSAEHLENGGNLYPTPQTTVAVALVRNRASDSQSPAALRGDFLAALETVRTRLGFGLGSSVDLMNTPPVLDAGANVPDLRERVAYRTAIESLGAVLARLAEDTGLPPAALVEALGVDLADGALDGQGTAGPVAALANLGDVAAWFAALPVPHLPVPNADGGGAPIPVADTLDMMAGEAAALGVSWQGPPGGADIAFRAATIGTDTDADGWPDVVDPDDDNDTVPDSVDALPRDPLESVDTDADGVGNNADPDDDNDSFADPVDDFSLDPAEHNDHDADGLGDQADPDDDNDSIPDASDPALLLGALTSEVTAAVLDPVRQRVYATVAAERKLYTVDALTGTVLRDLQFDLTPERLVLSRDGTELYVALLAQPHSPYWWTEEQYGFIATV